MDRLRLHAAARTRVPGHGLTPTEKNPDAEEHDLVVRSVPIAEFERMMLDGTIRDECTLSAWGLYCCGRHSRVEVARSLEQPAGTRSGA